MRTGHRDRARRRRGIATGSALVAAAAVLLPGGVSAGSAPAYQIQKVSDYGGEPSITSDSNGNIYEASLLAPRTYRSSDGGLTWTGGSDATSAGTGDDCLGTDQTGAVYLCNLTIKGPGTGLLQADSYTSVDHGATWTHGAGPVDQKNTCGTSCNPFGVDRDWVDATSSDGNPAHSLVVLMYHDFYGPSHIWVNLSTDGGATFGAPIDILTHLNSSTAGAGNALALADTACSTVPSAVKIAKAGPHKGRIYAAWIAADPSSFGTGCNLSQAQAFHNLFVAWSDDQGNSWTPQLAYDAGLFHDTSTPFVGFTLDNQGNPYFGFAANNTAYAPQSCAVPQNPQTPDCEYDMYVVFSPDGGTTWDDGTGLVRGSASKAYKVATDQGTHWFPAISAFGPGQVQVVYLETPDIIPTDASGKQHPGGCFTPPPADPRCTSKDLWNLYAGQSSDLLDAHGHANPDATFTVTKVTPAPMHQGDICNLGIACPPTANRNLADFISVTITPDGCGHIAYADDHSGKAVESANQTDGCFATAPAVSAPEVPLPALLLLAGLPAVWVVRRSRRRVAAPRAA